MHIGGRANSALYISQVMITLVLIGSVISQVHAQALTPLQEDQDGDGDPLNEEQSIIFACSISSSAENLLGQFV